MFKFGDISFLWPVLLINIFKCYVLLFLDWNFGNRDLLSVICTNCITVIQCVLLSDEWGWELRVMAPACYLSACKVDTGASGGQGHSATQQVWGGSRLHETLPQTKPSQPGQQNQIWVWFYSNEQLSFSVCERQLQELSHMKRSKNAQALHIQFWIM